MSSLSGIGERFKTLSVLSLHCYYGFGLWANAVHKTQSVGAGMIVTSRGKLWPQLCHCLRIHLIQA